MPKHLRDGGDSGPPTDTESKRNKAEQSTTDDHQVNKTQVDSCHTSQYANDKYIVGWICAINAEYVAAQEFLDEEHGQPQYVSPNDNNNYTLGKASGHMVVISTLPLGEYGTSSAATVARDMLHSFTNVRIGLMVGIAGGAPSEDHDIRLGDIVVSAAGRGRGGVLQYDFGKQMQGQQDLENIGVLNQPPPLLRGAVSGLMAEYMRSGHQLADMVEVVLKKKPRLRRKFNRPDSSMDRLYESGIVHAENAGPSCVAFCDFSKIIKRHKRDEDEDNPAIHYGLIGSANRLMKDALERDSLSSKHGILCFEMEAAGLMNHFPCLVVRGICDYSDSHKNKDWQGFAAMMAAAYAKDLLRQIPPNKIEAEAKLVDIVTDVRETVDKIQHDSAATKAITEHLKSNIDMGNVEKWLKPPNPSINLNEARKLRHTGTGTWLLEHEDFQKWTAGQNRHLWLHGMAGCGKTVLSAIILDHILRSKETNVNLFFFFDFKDSAKQTLDGMLRSLIFQLHQANVVGSASYIQDLCRSHNNGQNQPTLGTLSDTLHRLLAKQRNASIILDALDESNTRCELIRWMKNLVLSPDSHHVRCIWTSRTEHDFSDNIPDLIGKDCCISLHKEAVNIDIRSYVKAQLETDTRFTRKDIEVNLRNQIQQKVGDGADGMFRWAVCQLDTIAGCLSPLDMEKAINNLPRNLPETYDRMMQSIPPNMQSDATRLLQFLVYVDKPLTLREAVDILATRIGADEGFKLSARLFRDSTIMQYCPGLVSIVEINLRIGRSRDEGDDADNSSSDEFYGEKPQPKQQQPTVTELHLAHFSVKEYLLTKPEFSLESASAAIAMTCVTYIEHVWIIEGRRPRDVITRSYLHNIRSTYPMTDRAVQCHLHHAGFAGTSKEVVQSTIRAFSDKTSLCHWYKHPGVPYPNTGLALACEFKLTEVIRGLLEAGSNVNDSADGFSPLVTAVQSGHRENVLMLLRAGAEVDCKDIDTPLTIASRLGHLEIVQDLLRARADVSKLDVSGKSPIVVASASGHEEIVRALLEAEAQDDGQSLIEAAKNEDRAVAHGILRLLLSSSTIAVKGYKFSEALGEVCAKGDIQAVQLFLRAGVDFTKEHHTFHSVLTMASACGHKEIVRALLEAGAQDNGEAVIEAVCNEDSTVACGILRLLLSYKSVVVGHYEHCEALGKACRGGHYEAVQLLLQENFNVKAPHPPFDLEDSLDLERFLCEAAVGGHMEVIKLLLEKGAPINCEEKPLHKNNNCYWRRNALEEASYHGHIDVVRFLLQNGANAACLTCNRPLQDAAQQGHMGIVKLLLEMKMNRGSTGALYEAIYRGHIGTVRLLLETQVDVHWKNSSGRTLLHAAARRGAGEIVEALLGRGADVNSTDDSGFTPLSDAAFCHSLPIVNQLLEAGADIEWAENAAKHTALHCIAPIFRDKAVRILIDAGANVHARDHTGCTPLHVAAEAGMHRSVKALLNGGADINARDENGRTALDHIKQSNYYACSKTVRLLQAWKKKKEDRYGS